MKKLSFLMLSVVFLFSGCRTSGQTSLSDILMPFPILALGATMLSITSSTIKILDKTSDLGKIIDKETNTDREDETNNNSEKPISSLSKWSRISSDLSKIAFGIATLPISVCMFALETASQMVLKG